MRRNTDPIITAAMDAWLASPNERTRNELMRAFLPHIHLVVNRYSARIANADSHALVSGATFRVLRALDTYDAAKGMRLYSYLFQAATCGVLDAAREEDTASRITRGRTKTIEATRNRVESALGRAATDDEVYEALPVADTDRHLYRNVRIPQIASLSACAYGNVEEEKNNRPVSIADTICDERGPDVLTVMERKEKVDEILGWVVRTHGVIRGIVVRMRLMESRTLVEIAEATCRTESGVSLLLRRMIPILQAKFRKAEAA